MAFTIFFKTRIEERYFKPIRQLIDSDKRAGEGFAIVALQCSLIEFLATTLEGKNFTFNQLEKNGYGMRDAKKYFNKFLVERSPFNKYFLSEKEANNFYSGVRCGLLHEARTKGGWRILAEPEGDGNADAINFEDKIIYRNNLQDAFEEFVKWYAEELPKCEKLQEAFKIKIDGLCQE